MKEKKAYLFPSNGLGDAFIFTICANQLHKKGYSVYLFHDSFEPFNKLFPFLKINKIPSTGQLLAEQLITDQLQNLIKDVDIVILQNDNSNKAKIFKNLKKDKLIENLVIFYISKKDKSDQIEKNDFLFNRETTVVENISNAISKLLNVEKSYETGLFLPRNLIHKKNKKRILINPTSRNFDKSWSFKKFISLYKKIEKNDLEPVFIMSLAEKDFFQNRCKNKKINIYATDDILKLFCFVFESNYLIGNDSLLGHIASYLNIPTLIIAKDYKNMRLWRPGWMRGKVITTSKYIPNIKFCRLRSNHWEKFISTKKVHKSFLNKFSNF
jgi:hypothetical protein